MLKLRLKRIGRKHDPSFRVVVTESSGPPQGAYLESVGFYNANLKQLKLNGERMKYWLAHGAQPTDVVHNLMVKEGVIESAKKAVHSTRLRKKEEKTATSEGGEPRPEKAGREEAPAAADVVTKDTAPVEEKEEKSEETAAPTEIPEGEVENTEDSAQEEKKAKEEPAVEESQEEETNKPTEESSEKEAKGAAPEGSEPRSDEAERDAPPEETKNETVEEPKEDSPSKAEEPPAEDTKKEEPTEEAKTDEKAAE